MYAIRPARFPTPAGTSATAAAAASAARYTPAVDIQDLVSLEAVQRELGLGPNGGLVYCLDYLAQNLDWLEAALAPLEAGACFWRWMCARGQPAVPETAHLQVKKSHVGAL